MMTIRRPTEPPPMTSILARTGEDNRCIAFLLFLMVMCTPHCGRLREEPILSYAVLPYVGSEAGSVGFGNPFVKEIRTRL